MFRVNGLISMTYKSNILIFHPNSHSVPSSSIDDSDALMLRYLWPFFPVFLHRDKLTNTMISGQSLSNYHICAGKNTMNFVYRFIKSQWGMVLTILFSPHMFTMFFSSIFPAYSITFKVYYSNKALRRMEDKRMRYWHFIPTEKHKNKNCNWIIILVTV